MDRVGIHMAAAALVAQLAVCKLTVTTAESCTGGLIAAAITDIPGASDVFRQGAVTYANEAKTALLGVDKKTLAAFGAVSEHVAKQMAEGARERAGADIAIAATGIAGPAGGSPEKPVGLVFIAVATAQKTHVEKHIFPGNRAQVREQAVQTALKLALDTLKSGA